MVIESLFGVSAAVGNPPRDLRGLPFHSFPIFFLKNTMANRIDISFPSEGGTCTGWLYSPKNATKQPTLCKFPDLFIILSPESSLHFILILLHLPLLSIHYLSVMAHGLGETSRIAFKNVSLEVKRRSHQLSLT